MKTLNVQVKSAEAARVLADFLQTIDYVTAVGSESDTAPATEPAVQKGQFSAQEKPSEFAGIWKSRSRKTDAQKLRKKAWQRKK